MTIEKDMNIIKVLAADARNERLDSNVRDEARSVCAEMVSEGNMKEIAQTVAFTVEEMQKKDLDFLNLFADVKNVAYGDKAAFNVRTGHVEAHVQAKGATTARSMVGSKQILVNTKEISARPAISIMDLRTNRVQMADLVREANREITNGKLEIIEDALQSAFKTYATPFYDSATGINTALLDKQIAYFRRLGPVTILGDSAAVSQLAGVNGMAMSSTLNQFSDDQINEFHENGFIGRYKGASVVEMANTYKTGTITPVLKDNWLYIIPAGVSGDMRNLKVVNEGTIQSFASQNIDDLVSEIRLDAWFGAAIVNGEYPTIGAYQIN